MNYWLFKSEPGTWSWDDQKKNSTTSWDGVRNYQASNNMKDMKVGDLGFFYHSVNEKRILGVVEVIKEYYPDHTDPKGRFGMVDVKAVSEFKTPITLADVKGDPKLSHLQLVTHSRLSVQSVDKAAWDRIVSLGNVEDL